MGERCRVGAWTTPSVHPTVPSHPRPYVTIEQTVWGSPVYDGQDHMMRWNGTTSGQELRNWQPGAAPRQRWHDDGLHRLRLWIGGTPLQQQW